MRTAAENYQARFQRVLDHIDQHLDEDLSVEVLAGVAAFSKHHFHRQFSALLGVGVHRYVQLLRLKRASYRLAFRHDSTVMQIALDSGYEGPEAFSRAFKQRIGQTPSAFRRRPRWLPWQAAYGPITQTRSRHMKPQFSDDQIAIVEVAATPVAVLRHQGHPARIGETVRRFIDWRKSVGLHPRTSATFNILHDDPDHTPVEDFRLDICAATDRPIAPNDAGVTAGQIPAGRCAVLRHVGSDDGLKAAATYLYADWLPRSGQEPRDFPLYVQRVCFFPDVAEHEAVTDVFLPIR